ncbi:hypothetical protein BpHYR1_007492, partial [Brachionus plicatilis]
RTKKKRLNKCTSRHCVFVWSRLRSIYGCWSLPVHSLTIRAHVMTKRFFLGRLFGLVSMILEPNFDLSGRQIESRRQMLSLLRTQILLHLEPLLQLVHLSLREQHSPLPLRLIRILGQLAGVARVRLDVLLVHAVGRCRRARRRRRRRRALGQHQLACRRAR